MSLRPDWSARLVCRSVCLLRELNLLPLASDSLPPPLAVDRSVEGQEFEPQKRKSLGLSAGQLLINSYLHTYNLSRPLHHKLTLVVDQVACCGLCGGAEGGRREKLRCRRLMSEVERFQASSSALVDINQCDPVGLVQVKACACSMEHSFVCLSTWLLAAHPSQTQALGGGKCSEMEKKSSDQRADHFQWELQIWSARVQL